MVSALQDGERIIPVRAELKLCKGLSPALYMMVAETTAEESRNAANKKEEPDRKVRQVPLLAQEAAFPDSSELNILEYYCLVNHDPNLWDHNRCVYQAR